MEREGEKANSFETASPPPSLQKLAKPKVGSTVLFRSTSYTDMPFNNAGRIVGLSLFFVFTKNLSSYHNHHILYFFLELLKKTPFPSTQQVMFRSHSANEISSLPSFPFSILFRTFSTRNAFLSSFLYSAVHTQHPFSPNFFFFLIQTVSCTFQFFQKFWNKVVQSSIKRKTAALIIRVQCAQLTAVWYFSILNNLKYNFSKNLYVGVPSVSQVTLNLAFGNLCTEYASCKLDF